MQVPSGQHVKNAIMRVSLTTRGGLVLRAEQQFKTTKAPPSNLVPTVVPNSQLLTPVIPCVGIEWQP